MYNVYSQSQQLIVERWRGGRYSSFLPGRTRAAHQLSPLSFKGASIRCTAECLRLFSCQSINFNWRTTQQLSRCVGAIANIRRQWRVSRKKYWANEKNILFFVKSDGRHIHFSPFFTSFRNFPFLSTSFRNFSRQRITAHGQKSGAQRHGAILRAGKGEAKNVAHAQLHSQLQPRSYTAGVAVTRTMIKT